MQLVRSVCLGFKDWKICLAWRLSRMKLFTGFLGSWLLKVYVEESVGTFRSHVVFDSGWCVETAMMWNCFTIAPCILSGCCRD